MLSYAPLILFILSVIGGIAGLWFLVKIVRILNGLDQRLNNRD